MKQRTLLVIALFLVVLLGLFYVRFLQFSKSTLSKIVPVKKIQVSMKVFLLKDIKTLVHDNIDVPKGWSAYDLLKSYNTVATKGEGINTYITTIDNHRADEGDKEFWAFYVNGKQASVGAGSYILQPEDKIEWKIEKY